MASQLLYETCYVRSKIRSSKAKSSSRVKYDVKATIFAWGTEETSKISVPIISWILVSPGLLEESTVSVGMIQACAAFAYVCVGAWGLGIFCGGSWCLEH